MKKIDEILKGKAVIFDVDGTLLDSMEIWRDAGERYLESLSIKAEEGLGDKLFAMTLEAAADYMIEIYGLPYSRAEIIKQVVLIVENAYFYEIPLKEGVREFLEILKKRNIPSAVATTSDRTVVEAAFKRLGIDGYFGKIFTCSEVGAGKDKPDIYLDAANYLNCAPEEIWVFEDAVHAAKTAKQAGFHVAGIYDRSSELKQDELKRQSELYLKSFTELTKAAIVF